MPSKDFTIILLLLTLLLLGLTAACTEMMPEPTPGQSPTPNSMYPAPHETITEPVPLVTSSPLPSETFTVIPPSATADCLQFEGEVRQESFESTVLEETFYFRVYVPPCYDSHQSTEYPVLYLLHGLDYNDDQWDRLGVDETADTLIRNGEAAPFMIVMPREPNFYIPDDSDYERVIVDELLPWVDSHYAAIDQREYRAIGGLSRGAAWSVHIGLRHWEDFGLVGAHSLPIFEGDSGRALRWLSEIPPDSLPRIFIDIGQQDLDLASAQAFEVSLNENDIPHTWYLFSGSHTEEYWQAHLEIYLRWYSGNW
ncbi:MAG: alpha/beta hydrolase-fold protein [Chloroflexota bacterium]